MPADAPSRAKVECSNAAGDLVVAGDGNGGLDTQLGARVADGPWTPLAGVDDCGALAVAPDARPRSSRLRWVRGGHVRPPAGREVQAAAAARRQPRDARGRRCGRIVFAHYVGTKVRFGTARVVAGAAPVVGADLPGVPAGNFGLDLASSPGGHSIVTWATKDGLRSMIDGGAAETVDPTTAVSRVGSWIADDGSAVIAHSSRKQEIIAVDRAGRGGVVGPSHARAAPATSDTGDQPQAPLTAVAPGGRAAVA